MKRFTLSLIALLLAALTAALCGCLPEGADSSSEAVSSAEASSAAVSSEAVSEKSDEQTAFIRGSVKDGVYQNELLGLRFAKPDVSWDFYSDEEIAELNGYVYELYDEETKEKLENTPVVYDMYAMDMYGSSINVNFENLGLVYGVLLSEADYCTAGLAQMEEAFAGAGMALRGSEIGKVTLGRKEHACIRLSVEMNGITVYETVAAVKCGRYMGVITMASQDPDLPETFAAMFEKL